MILLVGNSKIDRQSKVHASRKISEENVDKIILSDIISSLL